MFGVIFLPDFDLQASLRHQPLRLRQGPVALLHEDTAAKPTIFQCNEAATAAGVRVGMTSSQGLARYGALRLLPRSPAQEAAVAEALLESAFSCSPWVEATGEGICTFELRNARPMRESCGERVVGHLARLDLRAQVGIAANPDLALLAAHAARPCLQVDDAHAFMADLPITTLHPAPALLTVLRRWGIATLGALSALPPEEVTRRLGVEGHELWERATGRRVRLLRLTRPPETYEESMEFEYEVQTLEPLLFVLRRFIEQLALRLEAIYRVPAALTLTLLFDDGQEYRRVFRIPAPTGNVETLFRVLHTHLENFAAPSSVKRLHLAATPTRAPHEQFGLFETALRDPNRFGETLARLHALLGQDRAGVPCYENNHRPDAFRVEAPDFLHLENVPAEGEPRCGELPVFGLPLHRLRPPLPVQVMVERQVPVQIESSVASGPVRAARGPYQLAGDWWEKGGSWACEEWDVELVHGGLYRLCRKPHGWFMEGSYN